MSWDSFYESSFGSGRAKVEPFLSIHMALSCVIKGSLDLILDTCMGCFRHLCYAELVKGRTEAKSTVFSAMSIYRTARAGGQTVHTTLWLLTCGLLPVVRSDMCLRTRELKRLSGMIPLRPRGHMREMARSHGPLVNSTPRGWNTLLQDAWVDASGEWHWPSPTTLSLLSQKTPEEARLLFRRGDVGGGGRGPGAWGDV